MDTICSPYGPENPTDSGVLGAVNFRRDYMLYVSGHTLRYAKVVKFEANL